MIKIYKGGCKLLIFFSILFFWTCESFFYEINFYNFLKFLGGLLLFSMGAFIFFWVKYIVHEDGIEVKVGNLERFHRFHRWEEIDSINYGRDWMVGDYMVVLIGKKGIAINFAIKNYRELMKIVLIKMSEAKGIPPCAKTLRDLESKWGYALGILRFIVLLAIFYFLFKWLWVN